MTHIIRREAENDFNAFLVAQGMEDAGAQVFTIAKDGTRAFPFLVWGRYTEPVSAEAIDKAINKHLFPEGR